MNESGSGEGPVIGFCDDGDKPSDSTTQNNTFLTILRIPSE
jgi:hypothetical protein